MRKPRTLKKVKCVHCGRKKLEPDMLYVVALDEYHCDQNCFGEHYEKEKR